MRSTRSMLRSIRIARSRRSWSRSGLRDEHLRCHRRRGERATEVVREQRDEPLPDDSLGVEPLHVVAELLEEVSQLVLPLPRAQRRADHRPQRDEPEGPLEDGHEVRVLQRIDDPSQHLVRAVTASREDDRNSRPGLLRLQDAREDRSAVLAERLGGHDDGAGAGPDLPTELVQVRARPGRDAGAAKQVARHLGVPSEGREHQDPQVRSAGWVGHGHVHFSSDSPWPAYTGSPVSTPWNCSSGAPTVIPSAPRPNSRMVRSWRPLRFLKTEIA